MGWCGSAAQKVKGCIFKANDDDYYSYYYSYYYYYLYYYYSYYYNYYVII